MPLSTTFGNSSARNYGFKARSLILNTRSFTSSTSFTVPSTTTSLLSLTGQGGSGSVNPAYWASGAYLSGSTCQASQYGPSGYPQRTWDYISNLFYGYINSGTSDRTLSGIFAMNGGVRPDNVVSFNEYPATFRVRGSVYMVEPNGAGLGRTGAILYNTVYNEFTGRYWLGQLYADELYVDESYNTGDNTTGFGQTFAGGTGGAATPATYTNVAVTAGQTYTLTIPSGGSLQFSYYS